jgi:hypothetical protein
MASPVMTEMTRDIITASGSKLNVLGKTIRFVPQTVCRLYVHGLKYYPLQH